MFFIHILVWKVLRRCTARAAPSLQRLLVVWPWAILLKKRVASARAFLD
jgi:hypothetical protein